MLYSLPQLHGQAWHDILRDEPWYTALVGGRASDSPSRGPNLRKRKAPTETPSSVPVETLPPDAPAPAAKRMRIHRTQPTKSKEASPEAAETSSCTPPLQPILSTTAAPPSSTLSSRRNSTRPIRKPAKFTDPDWSESSSRSSSSSPLTCSSLLPALEAEPEADPEPGSRRDSASSARTLVGSVSSSRASSPMSDLTTVTLVDAEIVSAKMKAKKGKSTRTSTSAPSGRKKSPAPTKEKESEAPVRMMTRARTRVRAPN
ncbi:hypothetical protein AAF712_004193 [Marasmius tenuissimus]|uniref:Uncharacterized protein n=1 Tax=Marasmius tenuissimus TaxID=585030 RepID=A0ABR3A8K6_9AGAR